MCEKAPALAQQRPPGRGEFDVPAGPVKQRHPELAFEPADLLAQRRLGDVQSFRGPAEVKLFSDGDEVLNQPQI